MRRDILPSTAVLRSFEAAAKHQSFSAAAEELRVTQGAISRQVRDLEAALGVPLFRAAGRGVALTEAGRSFARRLEADLNRLRQSVNMVQAAGAGGKILSVAVLPTFSARWLVPRLRGFRNAFPDIELAIHSRSNAFDLIAEGMDLAIHYGREGWNGCEHTELCPENLAVVTAPAMAIDIHTPMDVASLPHLHLLSRRGAWPAFLQEHKLGVDLAHRGMQFDQFSAMIAAAIAGLGAAIVPSYLIEDELASGTLVHIGSAKGQATKYFVATPSGEPNHLAETFKTWVCNEAKGSWQLRSGVG